MTINIVCSSRYKLSRKLFKKYTEDLLRQAGYENNYILNLIFIGKNKMKVIASKYKNEKIALPVLAFPYKGEKVEGGKILGEIFICYPQAILLAAERNKKVDEIIKFLIEHGVDKIL